MRRLTAAGSASLLFFALVTWFAVPAAHAQTPTVSPIQAAFTGGAPDPCPRTLCTTTYTVNVMAPSGGTSGAASTATSPVIEWSGPACGAYRVQEGKPNVYVWYHPHPPCDPTTNHQETTVVAKVTIGSQTVVCNYQGADSGTGPPCTVSTSPVGVAVATTATPDATPGAQSTSAGTNVLPIAAVAGAAVVAGGAVVMMRRKSNTDADVTDCAELRRRCEEAQRDANTARATAEAARARANAARTALNQADAMLGAAQHNANAADSPEEGSWVEEPSTGRRITSYDLALEREYERTTGKANWGDQATLQRLRREASERAHAVLDAANAERDRAEALFKQADSEAEQAEAAAAQAQAVADAACAAADECERRERMRAMAEEEARVRAADEAHAAGLARERAQVQQAQRDREAAALAAAAQQQAAINWRAQIQSQTSAPRQPERRPLTDPRVHVQVNGQTVSTLNQTSAFRVVVEMQRTDEEPAETIDVTFTATDGSSESVRLRWNGGIAGAVIYESEPLSIDRGGEGGGVASAFGLAMSTGDMGRGLRGVENGTATTVTIDGVEVQEPAHVTIYTTWVQEGIGRYVTAIRQMETYWKRAIDIVGRLEDSPQKTHLLRHAAVVLRLADEARRILAGQNDLDTMKLSQVGAVYQLLNSGDLTQLDGLREADVMNAAREAGHRLNEQVFWDGMKGAVIGMWRTAAEVTGYSAGVKLFYGVDEMGQHVGTLERIFAALDLVGKITLWGATESLLAEVATLLEGGSGVAYAGNLSVRAGSGAKTLKAEAGTAVQWSEEFGMLRNRAAHFAEVADEYGVRIRVRPANEASLGWMAEGHPPKHVKLKSKTINEIDELIGAPLNARGQVGYFEPHMPNLQMFDEATQQEILKRFSQRSLEFHDEAKAMGGLIDKGLVRVEGGVVVDTGLSDTRLVGDHLETMGRNSGGTGKAFTGDHDMWDITRADGSPVDASTKAAVERNLMDGEAATQHGPHKDWVPQNAKDRAIDAKIRDSHGGVVGMGGNVVAAPNAEALIEFSPGQTPKVSYEMPGAAR